MPGSTASSSILVQGFATNIPSDNKVWIIVYDTAQNVNHYYPNFTPVSIESDGHWTTSTIIGTDNDTGAVFYIYAVILNHEGQEDLNAYFQKLANNSTTAVMLSLPSGIVKSEMTAVVRGK
jgi:hypothetical protein